MNDMLPFSITWSTTGGGYKREATVKGLRAGKDGHCSALSRLTVASLV